MLLAFASLGAGVSAEQSNEQMADLEELGVLELSIDEHGVVEAVITQDAVSYTHLTLPTILLV